MSPDAALTSRAASYLKKLGVPQMVPSTVAFDPGYDPSTLESHLRQSSHLMAALKISMACWIIADEASTRGKVAAAHERGLQAITGGGPLEVAAAQGVLGSYLDLCAEYGFDAVECSEGFTDLPCPPEQLAAMVGERGLSLQYELGKKHDGEFSDRVLEDLIERGRRWRDAGATKLVVEARERAADIGVFGADGTLSARHADRFVDVFGFDLMVFEAPDKHSQFALLSHFGPQVALSNVRLEEILRVEIFRRGLHSDAFGIAKLRPGDAHAD